MSSQTRLNVIAHHLMGDGSNSAMMHDQVVLITGGAQGIGEAAARLLARNGARIVINDVDASKADKVVQDLRNAHHEAISIPGDLLDLGFPTKLVEEVLKKWGKVNCLVNNAGFCFDSALHKMDEAKFDIVMKIHNYVPYRMIQALAGHWMLPENTASPKSIINISSTSGLHGSLGQINYSTAKAGINGMTKTVAAEWGRYNVRCNSVAFGWIDTRITRVPSEDTIIEVGSEKIIPGIPASARKWRDVSDIPLGRPGTVDEAAGVILFLASPLASYVTGTCVECTGGRFM